MKLQEKCIFFKSLKITSFDNPGDREELREERELVQTKPTKFRPFDVSSLIGEQDVKREICSSPDINSAPTLNPYLGFYQHLLSSGSHNFSQNFTPGLGFNINPLLFNSLALASQNPFLAYSTLGSLSQLPLGERLKQNRFSPYNPFPHPRPFSGELKSAFQSVLPKPSHSSSIHSPATPLSSSPASLASFSPPPSTDIKNIEKMVKDISGESRTYGISH